jgi:ketosteroid isomerase-like protein
MSDSHDNHPAIEANKKSIALAQAKDREGWLALYAEDAVVQDPVGVSPFDASGEGHKGKEAIARFYDTVIGPARLTITAHMRIPSGDKACAVHQTAVNDLGNGKSTKVDMIAIYELNDEGLIARMSAFWSWADMEKQLKEMGFM